MHAHTLERAVDAWFGGHPYGVFGEYQPGPPEQYVFKVRFLDPIPPTWAITLGDFAHNARSALDHLTQGRSTRPLFPLRDELEHRAFVGP